ncbi:MAG: hydroxymethylbilane synthase [Verrucomicrobiota bacterium]|jgi:hydroxymethylbilane synthase
MEYITLGTRGSELALTQAEMTRNALAATCPELVIHREIIRTSGDLRPDLQLSQFQSGSTKILDKGIFTKELEEALRAGTIHAAVHSLKDVPTILDEGFRIAAVLPRANVEDVLISRHPGGLDGLPDGALIATSSVRRARQLRWLRPDLRIGDIRGNVPTRIRKVADNPEFDALVLARAGLERLGLFGRTTTNTPEPLHISVLPSYLMLPAASQGAVGIEILGDDPELMERLSRINHPDTFRCVTAERHFLELLNAGCQTPIGVLSEISGSTLNMKAIVFPDYEGEPRRAEASGPASDPHETAARLCNAL